jgi:hypothetical protein
VSENRVTDEQLGEEIQAIVQAALGEGAGSSPLGRLQVRITGDSGGVLHDPED